MAFVQAAKDTLFQVNFQKTAKGNLANVYYTVFNADGTIYLTRRQTNVKEFGDGSYGVVLNFGTMDNYSIFWDIDGTDLVASEEIVVGNFNVDLQPIADFDD